MAGMYFEELEVGRKFTHEPGRTVTETDNLLFTALTLNPQPLHLDAEFAKESIHGQILVGSASGGCPTGDWADLRNALGETCWIIGRSRYQRRPRFPVVLFV